MLIRRCSGENFFCYSKFNFVEVQVSSVGKLIGKWKLAGITADLCIQVVGMFGRSGQRVMSLSCADVHVDVTLHHPYVVVTRVLVQVWRLEFAVRIQVTMPFHLCSSTRIQTSSTTYSSITVAAKAHDTICLFFKVPGLILYPKLLLHFTSELRVEQLHLSFCKLE